MFFCFHFFCDGAAAAGGGVRSEGKERGGEGIEVEQRFRR